MKILDQLVVGSFEFAKRQDGRRSDDGSFGAIASGFFLFFVTTSILSVFIVSMSVIAETLMSMSGVSSAGHPPGPLLPWVLSVLVLPSYYVFRGGPGPAMRRLAGSSSRTVVVNQAVDTLKRATAIGSVGLIASAIVLVALQ